MSEQRDFYRLSGTTIEEIKNSMNFILDRMADRFDRMEGLRGTPIIYSLELILDKTKSLVFQDEDGTSWRIYLDGDDLKTQVLLGGVWTDASTWVKADY